MRSTGEVMGIAPTFSEAVMKAFLSSGITVPESGTVFLSVNDNDKPRIVPIAAGLQKMNFKLVATKGTAAYIAGRGITVTEVLKASEGRPNVVDDIKNRSIDLIINTPLGSGPALMNLPSGGRPPNTGFRSSPPFPQPKPLCGV